MRTRRDRLSQQRAIHIRVSARLQHERAPQMVDVLHRPRALGEHGVALGSRQSFDDEPQWLSSCVRVDGSDAVDHDVVWAAPPIDLIRS